MQIEYIDKWLKVSLFVNATLMVISTIVFLSFRQGLIHYQPKYPLSNEQILTNITQSVVKYLDTITTNTVSSKRSVYPSILEDNISIQGGLRNDDFLLYHGSKYIINDYINISTNVYKIIELNFNTQKCYLLDESGGFFVLRPSSASGSAAAEVGRKEKDGTIL